MKNSTNVSVPKTLYRELKAVAAQIGCHMSTIATKAIDAYLDDDVETIIEKMKNDSNATKIPI